jgi:hypothetical protein
MGRLSPSETAPEFCMYPDLQTIKVTFETVAKLPITFSSADESPTPLVVRWCGIDCCYFIAAALMNVWPQIHILLCWAHISRKFTDTKLNLKHTANLEVIEGHVHVLRHTVSREQFFHVWSYVSVYWTKTLDEAAYAKSFGQYYVGSYFGEAQLWHASWYVTASGVGGVTAVSQNIENYNGSIKKTLGKAALYSALSDFFAVSLPKVVLAASKMIPANSEMVTEPPSVSICADTAFETTRRLEACAAVHEVCNVPKHVCNALAIDEGASVFLVCRPTNQKNPTATSMAAYFKTLKHAPTVPAAPTARLLVDQGMLFFQWPFRS